MPIPKIIHQIWLGPNKRPDIWMNSWKIDYVKKYPDWDYKLWTETDISSLKLINKKQYDLEPYYTGKSDIVRYEILNLYGGVFIDADSLWIRENNISLDKILNLSEKSGMFAAYEPVNKQILANGVIGFSKNHPILNNMIYFINKNHSKLKQKYNKLNQVWKVSGPRIFTTILEQYEGEKTLLDSYLFFPEDFHKNNLKLDIKNLSKKYPKSIMFQYGYTTNNILNKNIMKKFIDNT
jgi:inositol phosphorylceramide mannosyltransferase catalytic subunit